MNRFERELAEWMHPDYKEHHLVEVMENWSHKNIRYQFADVQAFMMERYGVTEVSIKLGAVKMYKGVRHRHPIIDIDTGDTLDDYKAQAEAMKACAEYVNNQN